MRRIMAAAGVAGLLVLSGAAQARTFSYNYVEGGVADEDHGSAIFAGGSVDLDPHVYALGSLYGLDFDHDVSGYYLEGGLGYHVPLTPQADFFVNGDTDSRTGIRVATKDVDGDAKADVIVGSGEGQAAQIRVYAGKTVTGRTEPAPLQDLDPFGLVLTEGVFVG